MDLAASSSSRDNTAEVEAEDPADSPAPAINHDHDDGSADDDAPFDDDDAVLESYELRELGRPPNGAGADDGTDRGRKPRRQGSSASFQLYTPDEERAVVRKFDRRLVVFVAALYMLSFLDRSNIGNARVAGMDADLQAATPEHRDDWYEWALTAFYMSYITFEWMSLLWRVIPAHIYVSAIVLSWGLTASLQAITPSYPMLILVRALLGIGEAAFTGVPFYLSFFFKRHELAFRTAIFISAAPLATTFASSLAWLILWLGAAGPIAPWRLLFLIEGFPAVLVAPLAWRVIPDSPETASYLTPREKRVARLRMRHEREPRRATDASDGAAGNKTRSSSGSASRAARDVLAVLADPAAWLTALIFFLANMAYASLPVFLPTILTAMGHSPLAAQALAAPPYLVSFGGVLAAAALSDRARARGRLIAAHALASAAGYAVLAAAPGGSGLANWLRYAAVFPAAAGFFGVVVLTLAWSINNQRSAARRGGGFALLQLVGQCGPLVGTRLYPDRDAPLYRRGMAVCCGAMLGVAALALLLLWYLGRLNRRMDEGGGEDGAYEMVVGGGDGGGDEAERDGLVGRGRPERLDEDAAFRYML